MTKNFDNITDEGNLDRMLERLGAAYGVLSHRELTALNGAEADRLVEKDKVFMPEANVDAGMDVFQGSRTPSTIGIRKTRRPARRQFGRIARDFGIAGRTIIRIIEAPE